MKQIKSITKPKKITVRFFLQKNVHPEATQHDGKKESAAYPLYLYVTYNRKNMQFKSNYGMFYTDMSDVEVWDKGLMAFEEKLIEKIIRYETSQLSDQDEYDMRGLKDKYEIYSTSIHMALEQYLKPKLRMSILKTNNELQHALNLNTNYYHNTVLRLYKVAGLVFDNFFKVLDKPLHEEIEAYKKLDQVLPRVSKYDFPTVIDWLDGSYKKELKLFLNKVFKNKPEFISSIVKLIENAVDKKTTEIKKIDQKYTEPNQVNKKKKRK